MKSSYSKEFPQAFWLKLPLPDRDPRDRRFQCRKTFDLTEVPAKAEISVTADSKYSLWVNGKFVNFGPARGFQPNWPFDRIDIAPYLRPGKNVIAALLYTFGLGNYTYTFAGEYGFLLGGNIGGIDISTNETWKIRIAPGYICAVARGSGQYGFQEFYDFRQADDNWFSPDYDDSNWTEKTSTSMRIAGCMPWHAFEERAIPLLTHEIIQPRERISVSRHTPAADGWQKITHIYHSFHQEQFQWQEDRQDGGTAVFGSGIAAQMIDFGEETVGKLRFEIEHASEGLALDYLTCECEKNGVPGIPDSGDQPSTTLYGGRLILREGRNELELTLPWGFRYVVLWIHEKCDGLTVNLSCRRTWYPLEIHGQFEASDLELVKIWNMCVQTQRCCTVDSYIDCPWRENAQWWGDALVQAQNTFRLAADDRVLTRGLRQIATQKTPNGLTYGMAPTIGHTCILQDYSAMWMITLWAQYFQTGNTDLYRELADTVDSIDGYFHDAAERSGIGLVPYDRRYWLFLDWCPALFKNGTPTLLNLIRLLGLKRILVVAEAAGDSGRAARFKKEIESVSKAIIGHLYDPKTKLLYDGLNWDGTPVDTHAPHSAAFAILLDLLPEAHETWLQQILLPLVKGSRGGSLQPSAYFMFYIFEALKKKGYRAEVIDCIRRWWGEFTAAGCSTTPEGFLEQAAPGQWSFCHAWSSHPIVHFSEILLGVTPVEPGWQAVRFDPLPVPGLDIRGTVPTPKGDIHVSVIWKNGKSETSLTLPHGIVRK